MLMDANQFADDKSVAAIDKVVTIVSALGTTTYSMDVTDQVVLITTGDGYALTITLPSVASAKGRLYSFRMVARGGTSDATLQDLNGDAALTDITFNLAADAVLLYSDGFKWHALYSTGV